MYTKRNYGFWMTFNWSKKPFIIGFLYSTFIALVAYFLNMKLSLPWQPISVIGIAVAFYLGFKNNSSYDRTWEARKIWGSIVNNSRSVGAAIVSFVQGDDEEEVKRELIYRHIAWMTALRFQLRLSDHGNILRLGSMDCITPRYVKTIITSYIRNCQNICLKKR